MFNQYIKHTVLFFNLIFINCGLVKSESDDYNYSNLIYNGVERQYILHLPETYDGSTNLPLIINFHGFGGNAGEFMDYTGMNSVAESDNFIVAYPQGLLLDGFSHWNAALDSSDNKSDADDIGFVRALIETLTETYSIDPEMVYVCGFSNGGMFSYALACYTTDLIAGVGSVSGAMLDISSQCTPDQLLRIISFHGTEDSVIPYNGSDDYNSVDETLQFWSNYYNMPDSSLRTLSYNNISIDELKLSNNGPSYIASYKVNSGEHVWFDLEVDGMNTSMLISDFFLQPIGTRSWDSPGEF